MEQVDVRSPVQPLGHFVELETHVERAIKYPARKKKKKKGKEEKTKRPK